MGSASYDFSQIDWTDSLFSTCVSYYHTNSAGRVDVVLLKDVTGNCYEYGTLITYTGDADKQQRYLLQVSVYPLQCWQRLCGHHHRTRQQQLHPYRKGDRTDPCGHRGSRGLFRQDGSWYVDANGAEYRVCDDVEVHIYSAGTWLSGEAGLLNVLADGDDLALYTDRSATSGGQIRIIRATMSD